MRWKSGNVNAQTGTSNLQLLLKRHVKKDRPFWERPLWTPQVETSEEQTKKCSRFHAILIWLINVFKHEGDEIKHVGSPIINVRNSIKNDEIGQIEMSQCSSVLQAQLRERFNKSCLIKSLAQTSHWKFEISRGPWSNGLHYISIAFSRAGCLAAAARRKLTANCLWAARRDPARPLR